MVSVRGGLLFVGGAILLGVFLFVLLNKPDAAPPPPTQQSVVTKLPTNIRFQGFPATYLQCTQAVSPDSPMDGRTSLRCPYIVHRHANADYFELCKALQGKIADDSCTLVFYNAESSVPFGYADCVDEHKGEVVGDTCRVVLNYDEAFNKNDVLTLMLTCQERGGTYVETPDRRCTIEFSP